jgi:hypothetical protein
MRRRANSDRSSCIVRVLGSRGRRRRERSGRHHRTTRRTQR